MSPLWAASIIYSQLSQDFTMLFKGLKETCDFCKIMYMQNNLNEHLCTIINIKLSNIDTHIWGGGVFLRHY